MVSGNTKLFNIEGSEKDYHINSDIVSGKLSIDNKKISGFSSELNNSNATKNQLKLEEPVVILPYFFCK
ncbi:hypothetical protein AZF37_07115 [endosymbiont 'TC1' of Trimyema compressum]|nr:hypothetical protein AZF37_07115 [endosymbiont 'TC1' of Trimyema compressum]